MIEGVTIRRVTATDTELFSRIAADVFDEPIIPAHLAAYLDTPGHLMIVATKDGEIVGQTAAVVHRHPDKVSELRTPSSSSCTRWTSEPRMSRASA